jgi:hypothetical protein
MQLDRFHRGTALLWATAVGLIAATAIAIAANPPVSQTSTEEEVQIAKSLAVMLRAGRTVVSHYQDKINDPNIGPKGFDSKTVLAEAAKIYQESAGIDPMSIDRKTRHGKLVQAQMDAMAEVVDAHQETLNRKGVAFKGFIPAVFGRLVNEAFGRRAVGVAEMKVTAPAKFIRNAKAKADDWESEVIRNKLASADWPKNQSFAAVAPMKDKLAHRTAVPEYYGASCLTCHGSPQGEIDITGYPKEGGKEGDLGGVISITLFR